MVPTCRTRTPRPAALCLALVQLAVCLSACVGLPQDVPRPISRALAPDSSTSLGALAAANRHNDGMSGFRLLPSPDFAFDARVELISRAQRSLDVQYYEVRDDQTGCAFLKHLRDAARRGVRVRLLVDDLYTAGEDELLLGLAAEPNVEVRLF